MMDWSRVSDVPSREVPFIRHYGIEDTFTKLRCFEENNVSDGIAQTYEEVVGYDTIKPNSIFSDTIGKLPKRIKSGKLFIGFNSGNIDSSLNIGDYQSDNSYTQTD